jgi:nitrogen fixation/metabolism regulation signal transduction histidine kinase
LPKTIDGEASGSVLVIEDLSELIAAQRASAWQEVARRMAHEIKNPLTPIQLSAERIAKNFTNGDTQENHLQINTGKNCLENKDQRQRPKTKSQKLSKTGRKRFCVKLIL